MEIIILVGGLYALYTVGMAIATELDYRAFNREELRKLRKENDKIMATLTKWYFLVPLKCNPIEYNPNFSNMAIATYTIQFNEYELETILAAMDDYRDYDAEGMDPEDLIGRTPVLERINSIDDKISDAFANQ